MSTFPGLYHVERRYMEYKGERYLLDVISTEGFSVIAEQISTGKKEEGFHRTSEASAVMDAIEKF